MKLLPLYLMAAGLLLSQKIPDHVQGRLLAQKTLNADSGAVTRALNAHGAKIGRFAPELGMYVLSVPEAAIPGITKALTATGLFTFVETDGIAKGGAIPNDPNFSQQWHLGTINAVAAWDISVGSTSVPIAMVDSGVNPSHPDLASKLIPGWNFLTSSSNTADDLGHGSATAGVAGAASNNAVGVTGVGWLNPIMPLVVLDSSDYASYSNIASAITYAADHGVRIVNISIGGTSSSSAMQSAVNYAWNKGTVVFASAMNSSTSTPYYPAACDNVVAVSATEPGDTLAWFSNFGSWIDLAAPGDNILTTDNNLSYSTWAGTSFSSPIAAATGALALSINPALTAQGLVTLLEQNTDDIGAPGFDTSFGWGRINAYKVANAALTGRSTDTTPPTVTIASPVSGSIVSGSVTFSGTATDNVGVVRTELWIDGNLTATCSGTFSCSWNSGSVTAGTHTAQVIAYDAAGNSGSASESITIPTTIVSTDTQAPSVAFANPLNGQTVTGTVTVKVSASDNVAVAQVSIYIDGVLRTSLATAPYTYSWNTKKSASGSHTLTAQAWDAAGNTSTASITVKK